MSLDSVRDSMSSEWEADERRGADLKDPYVPLFGLQNRYQALPAEERAFADLVLAEWVLSTSAKRRFDAIATVAKFGIRAAVPSLRELASRLDSSNDIADRNQLERVKRLISKLEPGGQAP